MFAILRDFWKDFLSRQNKISNKIFLPFIVMMILIGALIIYIMTGLLSNNVETRVNEKLRSDVRLIQEIVYDMEGSLTFYAQFISDTEKLASHISEARDSRLVLIQLLEFLKENQISSSVVGESPLATGNKDLSRLGMLGLRATGLVPHTSAGEEQLSLSAVAPIQGHVGSRSVVTVSRDMNREFLQNLLRKTGAHRIQIYHNGKLIESSSPDEKCDEAVKEMLTPTLMKKIFDTGNLHYAEFNCQNHSVKMVVAPLIINYKKEALIAVFESMDDLVKAKTSIIITTAIVVGLTLLIIVPIFIMTVSRIVAPIRELSRASKDIAEGRLEQHVPVRTGDEVGELSESFNRMIDDLIRYREDIEHWNQTLEERVAERTQQLAEAQAKLIQSTKLAAVGELAAGIAHELNNPLAGIYAFLQVFAKTLRSRSIRELDEEEARSFEENLVHVEREIQRCKSTIGSLLTFARVSEKQFMRIDLNKVIMDTLAFTKSNLEKGNIEVETHLAENLPQVKGDFNELQQVFLNIIVNARNAMPEGGRLVVATSSASDDHTVKVSFSDTGEGIKPENLEKIFDPFFTTRDPGEGTGLGLSISYGIIKDHEGEILVKSEPGIGSTFTIVLPAAGMEPTDDASLSALTVSRRD